MHCKVGHLPIHYLSLPIGANATSKKVLDPKVEKFEKKLSTWKRQYLSFGGRVTLIQATNVPIQDASGDEDWCIPRNFL